MATIERQIDGSMIGVWLDHAGYNADELSEEIIEIAEKFGFQGGEQDTDLDEMELSESLYETSEEAIDYLNEITDIPYCYWYNCGDAGAFGLWVDSEGVQEAVQNDELALVDDPPEGTETVECDGCVYVTDHGNMSFYVKRHVPVCSKGKLVTYKNTWELIWSIV